MRWRSRRLRVRGEFFVSWVEEERGPAALSFFGESKRKGQVCRGGAGSNASAHSQTQAFLFFLRQGQKCGSLPRLERFMRVQQHSYRGETWRKRQDGKKPWRRAKAASRHTFFRIRCYAPRARLRPHAALSYNSRDAVAVYIAFEHAHELTLCARKSALSTGSSE